MPDQQRSRVLPMLLQQEKGSPQDAHQMKVQAGVNHTKNYFEKVQKLQQDQQDLYVRRAQINLPPISPTRGSRCAQIRMTQGHADMLPPARPDDSPSASQFRWLVVQEGPVWNSSWPLGNTLAG